MYFNVKYRTSRNTTFIDHRLFIFQKRYLCEKKEQFMKMYTDRGNNNNRMFDAFEYLLFLKKKRKKDREFTFYTFSFFLFYI